MNAASKVTLLFEKRFPQNHRMHDWENFMFPVVVPFHLRTVGKELPHSSVLFTRDSGFMGAHDCIQPAVEQHIEERFVGGNRRNSRRYVSGKRDPFNAARPLRAAGEPVDISWFDSAVLFQEPSDPNRSRHMVFGKTDVFAAQLLAADDVAFGFHKEGRMAEASGSKNGQ